MIRSFVLFLARGASFATTLAIVVLAILALGCAGDGVRSGSALPAVSRYLSSGFAVSDQSETTVAGSLVSSNVPTGGSSDFPTLTYGSTSTKAVRGGAITVGLDSEVALEKAYVGVEGQPGSYVFDFKSTRGRSSDSGGATVLEFPATNVRASIEYTKPKARGSRSPAYHYDLVVTVPDAPTLQNFKLNMVVDYVTGARAGARSRVAGLSVELLGQPVATKLSFAIQWGSHTDVDLHVVTPSGERIGFDHSTAQGGVLSVDTNAGCSENPGSTEKIEWSGSAPPAGVYRFGPNLFELCDDSGGDVAVTITVNSEGVQGVYRVVLSPGDENGAATLDQDKSIFMAVLPPKDTDAGMLARLLVSENPTPDSSVSVETIQRGMEAVKAVVYNRVASNNPHITDAPVNSGISQVITANSTAEQFQGFGGGLSASTAGIIGRRLVVFPAKVSTFQPYWAALFSVLDGPVSDPFTSLTKIGTTNVEPKALGLFSTSYMAAHPGAKPGGAFVAIPVSQGGVIAGNQYYTVPLGFH